VRAREALPAARARGRVQAFLDQFEAYRAASARSSPSCRAATPRWPTASPRAASCPKARASALDAYAADGAGGDPLAWAFGALGVQDRARHLATLYLNDLADVLRDAVDPRFEFVRYAESLAASQPSFDPLAAGAGRAAHAGGPAAAAAHAGGAGRAPPDVVLLSVPFPGAVYGALRIAQAIKAHHPPCASRWAAALSTPSCAS
jgi:hypothetical protein